MKFGVVVSERVSGFVKKDWDSFVTNFEREKVYIERIPEAIMWLHEHGIIHGDLHLGNLLFDDEKVAILDFGQSILYSEAKAAGLSYKEVSLLRFMDFVYPVELLFDEFDEGTQQMTRRFDIIDLYLSRLLELDVDLFWNETDKQKAIWFWTPISNDLGFKDGKVGHYRYKKRVIQYLLTKKVFCNRRMSYHDFLRAVTNTCIS